MNKTELISAVKDWWEWHSGQAQVAEARYFEPHKQSKRGKDFVVSRVRDVPEGLSIRMESSGSVIDGILNTKTGEWIGKDIEGLETFTIRGASIDG